MGNINIEKTKEDYHEKGSNGTKSCLLKIEKQVVPARVALLHSTNVWVGDLRVPVHSTNDRCRASNIQEGSGTGTMGTHGQAMTASSILDIAGTWCNKFGKEQLKATLKDMQSKVKCQPVQ